MNSMSRSIRNERMKSFEGTALTRQQYNGVLCGVLFYGLLLNFIICKAVGDITNFIDYRVFLIGYFVCCIAGVLMSSKSRNPLISFIGYNLVVLPCGCVVSTSVQIYGGVSSVVVIEAFMITMCITGFMTLLAIVKPEFCSKLGRLLFFSLLGVIVAELIMLIFGMDNILISWISAIIFSFYIAYDVWRSQRYPATLDNAVDSALDIYLDIINLFLDLLRIMSRSNDD